ncbi:hypothetical protein XAR_0576 [Xanthomonas citri pv. glycines str. 8ra]|nr:hypothetical protein XAR_0576 [Xanthomonas citri pv. glycines str. 8ra]
MLSKQPDRSNWMIELYKNNAKAQFIQLVATIGSDGKCPRFCGPTESNSQHCIWLESTCFELSENSWNQLKTWFEETAVAVEVAA